MTKLFSLVLLVLFLQMSNSVAAGGGGGGASNYIPLTPPFVVNIKEEKNAHFLQVTTEIKISNPELSAEIELHTPAIRHAMNMLLSTQLPTEIRTLEGKEALREEALAAIQEALEEVSADPELVEQVYFTSFVIQ